MQVSTAAKTKYLTIYLIVFFFIWWLHLLLFQFSIFDSISHNQLAFFLLKVFLWFLPVVYYLKLIDRVDPWQFLKINTNLKNGLLWVLGVLVILAPLWFAFVMGLRLKTTDYYNFTSSNIFAGLITAALFEEITIRGFILNKLREITSFWKANIITAFIFVAFHWQGWILIVPFSPNRLFQMSISIAVLSISAGYLVKRTNSIWPAVMLHGVQNMVALL